MMGSDDRAKFFKPKNIHDPYDFIPKPKRVVFGTIAGMLATAIVHPIDLIKVRVLTFPQRLSYSDMARRVAHYEGMTSFFSGLTAGILRQATNTSVRLSVYNILYDRHKKLHQRSPTDREKVKIGVIAGTAGAFVGNPSEVVLIRMMAQSAPKFFTQCPDVGGLVKAPYTGIRNAVKRIVTEEGVKALWKAGTHTIARSMIISAAQIGTYAKIRDYLLQREAAQGMKLHVLTAICSSFVAALFTFPIDIVKTRYQLRRFGVTKLQLWTLLITQRKLKWLLSVPFPPYYARLTIHTTLSFIFIENMNYLFYEHYKKNVRKGPEEK